MKSGSYILPNNKIFDLKNKDSPVKQMGVWSPPILLQFSSRVTRPSIPYDFDKTDRLPSAFLNFAIF